MLIRDIESLGQLIRDRRRKKGWSQAQLGERIGASRFWVADAEKGKPTAAVSLVLGALEALGLAIDVHTAGGESASNATRTEAAQGRARGVSGERTPLSRGGRPLRASRAGNRGRNANDS